jgi:hypothetical protein
MRCQRCQALICTSLVNDNAVVSNVLLTYIKCLLEVRGTALSGLGKPIHSGTIADWTCTGVWTLILALAML